MSIKFGSVRMRTNDKVIAGLLSAKGMLDAAEDVAEDIGNDVKSSTSSSARLKQFGRRIVVDKTERGARVGTTWGPAVPVEYGTVRTPPLRILTSAAERHGRTK